MSDALRIHILGAAGTVTGSKYLVDAGTQKIMVDCGLFQGLKKLRLLNWSPLPVDFTTVDTVLLTHGHLDHTGYLPKLVEAGFKGTIQGTQPTLDIAEIILRDSAKIQEEEADKANEKGFSRHKPAKPLYSTLDAERAIRLFSPVLEGEWLELHDGVAARLQYNGHILGSTFIELDVQGKRIVFSGDIGRKADVLMRSPKKPERADVLFIESTYGDRLHPAESMEERLKEILLKTVQKRGTLIIPSFAVERTQTLMFLLWQLHQKEMIPSIPFIMDSPMGANVLRLFHQHRPWHRLSVEDCKAMCDRFRIVKEYKETLQVIQDSRSKVIVAGSGMVGGGRVLSYLQKYLSIPETTVLLAGYQAEGTRGRALLRGASELKIYGQYIPVRAEVLELQALSAHGDQLELLDWLSELEQRPERVFIVHGEPHASDALRVKIKDTYGWTCEMPELYEVVDMERT